MDKPLEEPPKKPTVLKDLDFTRKLHISREDRPKIIAQMAADCKVRCCVILCSITDVNQFLEAHRLMDYSLLIGVRKIEPTNGVPDSPNLSGSASSITPASSPESQRGIHIKTKKKKDN